MFDGIFKIFHLDFRFGNDVVRGVRLQKTVYKFLLGRQHAPGLARGLLFARFSCDTKKAPSDSVFLFFQNHGSMTSCIIFESDACLMMARKFRIETCRTG